MTRPDEFRFMAVSLPGMPDPAVAWAAARAGEIGIIDSEFAPSADAVRATLDALRGGPRESFGVRLDPGDPTFAPDFLRDPPSHVGWVILTSAEAAGARDCIRRLRERGLRVLIEVTGGEQALAAAAADADGLIAKGNEAGGWIGDETAFVLFQRLAGMATLPVWVQGGIGPHTIAAARIGGAAGVLLDAQLTLLKESPLPEPIRHRIARMDGSETFCLGDERNRPFRVLAPPRSEAIRTLQDFCATGSGATGSGPAAETAWRGELRRHVGWGAGRLWPLGQDAAFAHRLAGQYGTVERALRGLRAQLRSSLRSLRHAAILSEASPWAVAHGTRYPLAQGPMTRVSDTPAFAAAVANAGGLPFLALGMQRAEELEPLLAQTRLELGARPWGVGLLGFVETSLRDRQFVAVRRHRPPFAIVAGGQPEQARSLEAEDIRAYLHVPTPELLKLFVEDGVRRFVFEGRECGGHVGPLSSFVLWDQAVQALLDSVPAGERGSCHVLVAGGIHDARSAAMAAAAMASLAESGVKIGFLMGTSYLFTKEAVSSGAILESFQRQALACRRTVLLETGPGHAVRCAPTPYANAFSERKARLRAEGAPPESVRATLETMNIGRLRLAAKGVMRRHDTAGGLATVDESEQFADGLFMLGQAAALCQEVCAVTELHHDVSMGGTELLREASGMAGAGSSRAPAGREGIAIVGMSCLLPGARDLDRFWTNILNKTNSIREVPANRWDWKLYFDERREAADRVYARWGGFLDPIPFDPARYGMPPSSLASIEPIQLLALETARAALRDAGYEERPFPRENTSVIIGVSGGLAELGQNYVLRSALAARPDQPALSGFNRTLPEWTEDSFAGILLNVIAGRIANRFDLGGPSFAVDAACASSLAAVYLACRELESGASDMTLVGGADTFQTPFNYLCFCKTQALSPRGRCRTFDHTADGTCISEGLSMLVLKRLADAELDGDRIYAIIRSVGASSDGRAKGLTAPSPEGQARALHRAYARAGVSPATVGLVEAHGTGTVAGDRAEIESLRRVFDEAGTAAHSVALGSVKSMIGHTKGAAGVTGLLKVALSLHHKILPATIGVEKPNESLAGGALYANAETRPWLHSSPDNPRRAAVSAFGFGGANYHVVAEEYNGPATQAAMAQWPCELFVWREESVTAILARLADLLASLKAGAQPTLKNLAFTLWRQTQQRTEGAALAMVASSLEDLTVRIETVRGKLAADPTTSIWDTGATYFTPRPLAGDAGIAFLFPGQGSQYPDMLRELAVHFHEVREAFETADRTLAGRFARPLSSFVFPPPRFNEEEDRAARKALTATHVAQPALGAAAIGLLNLLRALGLAPRMTAGHSYGEYAALCAAGCLTPEQLFDLSESRGRFIMEEAHGDLGTMAAVEADEEKTRALVGHLPDLWIANLNSPRQTIVSGTKSAVAEALKQLEAREITAQAIPVACAFHSPLVAPAKERLKEYLGSLRFEAPQLRVFANATGGEYPADPDAIREQLGEHLVSPVRFVSEIEAMYAEGARVFVEVGPRSVLTGLTDQILADRERLVVPLETRKRSGLEALLHALAQLAAHGAPVNLERLYEGRQPREHVLERLIEETRETPPPATAWWVHGGLATPLFAAAQTASEPPASASPGIEPQPTETIMNPPAPTSSAAVTGRARHPDMATVMRTHEQVMQQLLDTHRRVMTAAMGKGEVPQTQANPAVLVAPEPVARMDAAPAPAVVVAIAASPVNRATPPDNTARTPQTTHPDYIRQEVLRIVGERTGYPPDMLDTNADLEADLGIDSIKRVEIAGRLRKAFPHIGATADTSKVGNLASLRTLSALIERIASVPADGGKAKEMGAGDGRASGGSGSTPTAAGVEAGPPHGNTPSEAGVHVPRFMMRLEEAPALGAPGAIRNDGVFLVTDDEKGLADAVAEAIVARGGHAVIVSAQEARRGAVPRYQADFSKPGSLHLLVSAIRKAERRIAGIVHLLPLLHRPQNEALTLEGWHQKLREDVKALFFLAQAAAEDLKAPSPAGRARVLAALETDGAFPGHGGVAGLINALATEWPELAGRTLALDSSEPTPALAQRILNELQDDSPDRFVRLHNEQRQIVRIEPAALDPRAGEQMRIGPDWVILLTGGACGITGQVALELAERFKPTLVLTGRSPLPADEEAPLTRGVDAPAEVRRLLAGPLAESGGKVALADVEAAYRRLCREREIRATLAALRATGARVTYLQSDARDGKAFGETMDRIYAEFGRLDGIIHGAGVIEDRRVEEKTPESFDRVFDTKADGAFVIAQRLRPDSVKFVVFFSSVACLGNAGQSDYAAANGVMNTLAHDLDRRTPGRVLSVLWGPWQSAGMASEEIQRRFRERGVQIIPVAAGRRCLVEELLHGHKGEVEVLLGDAPYAPAVATPAARPATLPLIAPGSVIHSNGSIEVACALDPSRQAYLRDHMLDGKPVFPAAMAMELMTEAAWAAMPDVGGGIEIVGLQVQNGIILEDNGPTMLRVAGERAVSRDDDRKPVALAMQIAPAGEVNRAHYRAAVRLGARPEPPRLEASDFAGLEPFPLSVGEAYRLWLFQGRCFAGITAIEGIRMDAIAGMLHSVATAVCLPESADSHWLIDPTVVDASLQLVILWERHWHDMTPLPMQIARFRLFESLSDQPVRCLVKATAGDGGESLTADIYYTDTQGRMLAVLEGLQCACTKALNRLSGSAGRQTGTVRGERRLEATR